MKVKLSSAYKSIGEVVKILNNEEPKTIKINSHTLRFWETQFSKIKPKLFNNNRRHYDSKTIEILKFVKFLLKSEGMTIQGVKKHLNDEFDRENRNILRTDQKTFGRRFVKSLSLEQCKGVYIL